MKADSRGRTWLLYGAYYAVAIAIGIVVGLAVVAFAGGNVGLALSTLLTRPITTSAGVQQIFVRFIILCLIGLGVGLALKAGLWNIGGQGQMIIGMVMVFVVFTYMRSLASPLLFVAIVAAAALGGLAWIVIPVILKTKVGANEIVVTLLLNIVASNFGLYMTNCPKTWPGINPVTRSRRPCQGACDPPLPHLCGAHRSGSGSGPALARGADVLHLEANTVGESTVTARYAGIGVTRVITITMLVAGALAGLAGAFLVMGYLYHPRRAVFHQLRSSCHHSGSSGRKARQVSPSASRLFAYVTIGVEEMAVVTGKLQSSIEFAIEGIMLVTVLFASYLIDRSKAR